MLSPWSTSQLPKGTSFLTHSALRAFHCMLVGCSIQAVYDTIAHDSTTRKGAAITMRRRRRLRLPAGPPGCSPPSAPSARDAGDSAASGGAFTPEPVRDRRRPLISLRPSLGRTRHGYSDRWLSQSRAVWATSRQPWSIVSECPRSGNSTKSVMAGDLWYSLRVEVVMAAGTV